VAKEDWPHPVVVPAAGHVHPRSVRSDTELQQTGGGLLQPARLSPMGRIAGEHEVPPGGDKVLLVRQESPLPGLGEGQGEGLEEAAIPIGADHGEHGLRAGHGIAGERKPETRDRRGERIWAVAG
jgi:hypothetical protein